MARKLNKTEEEILEKYDRGLSVATGAMVENYRLLDQAIMTDDYASIVAHAGHVVFYAGQRNSILQMIDLYKDGK